MEQQKILARYDSRAVKKQALILLLLSVVVIGASIGIYFWHENLLYLGVLLALAAAMIAIAVGYFRNADRVAIKIEGKTVTVKDKKYDITSVIFQASIVFNSANKTDLTLDEIASGEIIPGLVGNITVATNTLLYKFSNLADVMTIMQQISLCTDNFILTLWRGNTHRRYNKLGGNSLLYKNEINNEAPATKEETAQTENTEETKTSSEKDSETTPSV